jgi:hypothetical protein
MFLRKSDVIWPRHNLKVVLQSFVLIYWETFCLLPNNLQTNGLSKCLLSVGLCRDYFRIWHEVESLFPPFS